MAFKPRSVPLKLRVLRLLNPRKNFSAEERRHYLNLEKGYQGEVMFDRLTEELKSDRIVINDLCLEVNNTTFQIDTLIISQETIHPFEVKNYEGDYCYESDGFKSLYSKNEINNPLDQLKRSKLLLRQLLQSLGIHISIEGSVVFINPEFTLYQAPINAPIIYSSQLNRFFFNLTRPHQNLMPGTCRLPKN